MTNEKQNVNREYKDRLFKLVFGEKEELTTHRAEVKPAFQNLSRFCLN